MRKSFKCCLFVAMLLTVFAVTACGDNIDRSLTYSIDALVEDPESFLGEIIIEGIVIESDTRAFALISDAGDFYIRVDFRGSQPLPQLGRRVVVAGQLTENRPCCGPGFTITTTSYELLEE